MVVGLGLVGITLEAKPAVAAIPNQWDPGLFPNMTTFGDGTFRDCSSYYVTDAAVGYGGSLHVGTHFASFTPGYCMYGWIQLRNYSEDPVLLYGLDVVTTASGMVGGAFSPDGNTEYITDSEGWFIGGPIVVPGKFDSVYDDNGSYAIQVWLGAVEGAPKNTDFWYSWWFRTWQSGDTTPTETPYINHTGDNYGGEHGKIIITKYAGEPGQDFYPGMGNRYNWMGNPEPNRLSGAEYSLVYLPGWCPVQVNPIPDESEISLYDSLEEWCPSWQYFSDENIQEFAQADTGAQEAAAEIAKLMFRLGGISVTSTTNALGEAGSPSNPWRWFYGDGDEVETWQTVFMPKMVYYVWESKPPTGYLPGPGFFVSIPLVTPEYVESGNPNDLVWDVYAYPKNDMPNKIVKTVIDPYNCYISEGITGAMRGVRPGYEEAQGEPMNCPEIPADHQGYQTPPNSKVGDWVTYRIVYDVPTIPTSQTITEFAITDTLAPGMVLDPDSIQLTFAGDDAALYEDWEPYDWDPYDPSGVYVILSGSDLSAALASDSYHRDLWGDPSFVVGLMWGPTPEVAEFILQRQDPDAGTLQFVVTFNAYAQSQGVYENTANYYFNEFVYHSNPATVAYGGASIWKYAYEKAVGTGLWGNDWNTAVAALQNETWLPYGSNAKPVALAGATFSLYAAPIPADPLDENWPCPATFNIKDELSFYNLALGSGDILPASLATSYQTPDYEFVTPDDGHFTYGGIAYGHYCMVETPPGDYLSVDKTPVPLWINGQLDDFYYADEIGCSDGSAKEYFDCVAASEDWYAQDDILWANVLRNAGFPFPITGGSSSLIYAVIAGVIIAGTVYVLRRQKKGEFA